GDDRRDGRGVRAVLRLPRRARRVPVGRDRRPRDRRLARGDVPHAAGPARAPGAFRRPRPAAGVVGRDRRHGAAPGDGPAGWRMGHGERRGIRADLRRRPPDLRPHGSRLPADRRRRGRGLVDPARHARGAGDPRGRARSGAGRDDVGAGMRDVVIIGAGARGNRVFAELIATYDTGFSLCGVVEPDPARRAEFQRRYRIPPQRAFADIDELLAVPRFADVVFICTPDPTHFDVCRAVTAHGYDVLLEKPIATNLADCLQLLDLQHTYGNRIFVAHVLRYAPFFRRIKELIDEGRFGAVRYVQLAENVGHWHFAHSYVRGNWRRAADSAPIILTKSSHDLDILVWLIGRRVTALASQGALTYFTEANAPPDAADRCVACPRQETCLYSATRFYLNDRDEWPFDVVAPGETSIEARRRALESGPYGRCVWRCDNDVCDVQTVTLEFDDGLIANFGLFAHTADN